MLACIDHEADFPCPGVVGVLHEFLKDGGACGIISEDLAYSCSEVHLFFGEGGREGGRGGREGRKGGVR